MLSLTNIEILTKSIMLCLPTLIVSPSFAIVGNPYTTFSDNGPLVDKAECIEFSTSRDNITVCHSPKYHPGSNSRSKRAVQIAKKAIEKLICDIKSKSTDPNFVMSNQEYEL
jgi:hypothetical protein